MPPPKGRPLTWLGPYNDFREKWQAHYGHTSFFGDSKPDHIRDWHIVRDQIDPRAADAIERRLDSEMSKAEFDKVLRNERVKGNMARLRADRKAALNFA